MSYLNKDKFERASDVVSGKRKFEAESAEARALALGKEQKLSGDELIDFVYTTLGGAKTDDPKPEKAKAGVIKEEVDGKEVEEVGKPRRRASKK